MSGRSFQRFIEIFQCETKVVDQETDIVTHKASQCGLKHDPDSQMCVLLFFPLNQFLERFSEMSCSKTYLLRV